MPRRTMYHEYWPVKIRSPPSNIVRTGEDDGGPVYEAHESEASEGSHEEEARVDEAPFKYSADWSVYARTETYRTNETYSRTSSRKTSYSGHYMDELTVKASMMTIGNEHKSMIISKVSNSTIRSSEHAASSSRKDSTGSEPTDYYTKSADDSTISNANAVTHSSPEETSSRKRGRREAASSDMIGDSMTYSSRLRVADAAGVKVRPHAIHRNSRAERSKSLRGRGGSAITNKYHTRLVSPEYAM